MTHNEFASIVSIGNGCFRRRKRKKKIIKKQRQILINIQFDWQCVVDVKCSITSHEPGPQRSELNEDFAT